MGGGGCIFQKSQVQEKTTNSPKLLKIIQDEQAGTITVFRANDKVPILTHYLRPGR